jgi:hypothetical protein
METLLLEIGDLWIGVGTKGTKRALLKRGYIAYHNHPGYGYGLVLTATGLEAYWALLGEKGRK